MLYIALKIWRFYEQPDIPKTNESKWQKTLKVVEKDFVNPFDPSAIENTRIVLPLNVIYFAIYFIVYLNIISPIKPAR